MIGWTSDLIEMMVFNAIETIDGGGGYGGEALIENIWCKDPKVLV